MSGIKLPVDAAGKEVPLDTKWLYDKDGVKRDVFRYLYSPDSKEWEVRIIGSSAKCMCTYTPESFAVDPPDSWEKLLEDLDETVKNERNPICKCAIKDIADRIRKLRGGEGE